MNAQKAGIGILFAALLAGVAARAQVPGDQIAVFGTGKVGSWSTELTLSNPLDAAATVEVKPSPGEIVCLQPCDFTHEIPARGTIVLPSPPPDGIGVTYVDAFSTTPPRVLARVLDANGRSVDLPTFRLGELIAMDASELVFPGAQRWAEGTVNLLLVNVWDAAHSPAPVSLRLEAFDANGASLSARDLDLSAGEVRFMADALGFLGVSVVEVGQLSVRRTGGAGRFWGTLSIVRKDGSLSVSVGAVP
jgi:hypothetical protein